MEGGECMFVLFDSLAHTCGTFHVCTRGEHWSRRFTQPSERKKEKRERTSLSFGKDELQFDAIRVREEDTEKKHKIGTKETRSWKTPPLCTQS